MSGNTNFPTALDGDSQLFDVVDAVTAITAPHHNNMKEAIKALEAKVGVYSTSEPTSIDYRLGNATGGHNHNGASGMGGPVAFERLVTLQAVGTVIATSNLLQLPINRAMTLNQVGLSARFGPSGATMMFDLSINGVSVLSNPTARPSLNPGASQSFTPIFVTPPSIPSGVSLQVDADLVGSSFPGRDVTIVFMFRDR